MQSQGTLELSARDKETFFSAVLDPPEPSPLMVEAMKTYKEIVGDERLRPQ